MLVAWLLIGSTPTNTMQIFDTSLVVVHELAQLKVTDQKSVTIGVTVIYILLTKLC